MTARTRALTAVAAGLAVAGLAACTSDDPSTGSTATTV